MDADQSGVIGVEELHAWMNGRLQVCPLLLPIACHCVQSCAPFGPRLRGCPRRLLPKPNTPLLFLRRQSATKSRDLNFGTLGARGLDQIKWARLPPDEAVEQFRAALQRLLIKAGLSPLDLLRGYGQSRDGIFTLQVIIATPPDAF